MKVFISYNHIDYEIAKKISVILEEAGIDYFLDKKDIALGQNIKTEVDNALIDESTHLIPIISPASSKSQWVVYEILTAVNNKKVILPFLSHPSLEVPFYIVGLKHTTKITEIETYFKKLKNKRSLNIELEFSLSYGGTYKVNKETTLLLVVDNFPTKKQNYLDSGMPILNLSVKNNEDVLIQLDVPTIEFKTPITSCFLPPVDNKPVEFTGVSFGDMGNSPLRVGGTIDYNITGGLFFDFYSALICDNIEAIVLKDKAKITYEFRDMRLILDLIHEYYTSNQINSINIKMAETNYHWEINHEE